MTTADVQDQSADDPDVNKAALKEIALPILTNMAMSFLELRRPRHALELSVHTNNTCL
jgi:hypothetical protein